MAGSTLRVDAGVLVALRLAGLAGVLIALGVHASVLIALRVDAGVVIALRVDAGKLIAGTTASCDTLSVGAGVTRLGADITRVALGTSRP